MQATLTPIRHGHRRLHRPTTYDRRKPTTDQTKPSFKTTELLAYLGTVVAIVITCVAVDGDDGGADPFNANDALKYITWATIGYMVARGLAKCGRRRLA